MESWKRRAKPLFSTASVLWLNGCFWLGFSLVTPAFVIGGVIYVLAFLLITRDRRKTKWLIRRTISHYGAAVIRCAWPLIRVDYVDLAPDDKPPFVFVANHRSASDTFVMARLPYECIQVINNWPAKIPIFGRIAAAAGYLKVRKMPMSDFLRAGQKVLSEGASIIAFPEGTRSGSRKIGMFHGSSIRLAREAGASIVPLAISGSENIPRRGSMVLHPGQIVLSKLPAVAPSQLKDISIYQLKNIVRDQIRRELDAQPVSAT
jgi:1-acyl-sn-glycerol-3-phosphate acyltransferase